MSIKTERSVLLKVSLLEAALIRCLRKYEFGKFQVTKENGQPTFITIEGKEKLEELQGIDLYIEQEKSFAKVQIEPTDTAAIRDRLR